MRVAEEVDAGQRRRAERERALAVDAAPPRRRQLDEVGDRARAALLRETDQLEQDLGGRLRIRQRAVARARARPEEVRERGEPEARRAAGEQAAREPDRVDDGRGEPPAAEAQHRRVEERHVEARVVRDEHRVAGELEEARRRERRRCGARRRSRSSIPVSAAICSGSRSRGLTSVCNVDASSSASMRTAPISQICERPGESPVVSRSTTQNAASSSSRAPRRAAGERDAAAAPREPRIRRATTSSSSDRAMPFGQVGEREERAGRLLDRNRAAPLLDELDEPVRGIEPKLHPSDARRTYVRVQARKGRPLLGRPPFDASFEPAGASRP